MEGNGLRRSLGEGWGGEGLSPVGAPSFAKKKPVTAPPPPVFSSSAITPPRFSTANPTASCECTTLRLGKRSAL